MNKSDTALFSLWDINVASVLLTRLPWPRPPEEAFARQSRAVWAFPLVGIIVGGLSCGIAWIAIFAQLPVFAVAGLTVAVLVATTGAMHEDGLADTVDGLWGGFTPERRLEIMKDSQIGTYGVLALLLSQLLRVTAVAALVSSELLTGVMVACVFSRALMAAVMKFLPNARQTGLSHSVGAPPISTVLAGLVLAALFALGLMGSMAWAPMLLAVIACLIVARIAKAKIGGQTGDVLGATQQITELTFLLTLNALI